MDNAKQRLTVLIDQTVPMIASFSSDAKDSKVADNSEHLLERLESLLYRLRTSTREYVSVIEAFPDREGRNLVRHLVKEREPVAQQLRLTIRNLGGDPTDPNLAVFSGTLKSEICAPNSGNREDDLLYACEKMDARLIADLDSFIAGGDAAALPFAYIEILKQHRNILATEVENLSAYRHALSSVQIAS